MSAFSLIQQEKNLEKALGRCIRLSEERDLSLTFYMIHGFLCAISCSPVLLQPKEWLPVLLNDDEKLMDLLLEEQDDIQAIIDLYNFLNTQARDRVLALPSAMVIEDNPLENFLQTSDLGQWAVGFVEGADWLQLVWDEKVPEPLEEDFIFKTVILSFFSNEQQSRNFFDASEESEEKTFSCFCSEFLRLMPEALKSYANIGLTLFDLSVNNEPFEAIIAEAKPGRNDLCSCGSGKKYKKCCLH